MERAAADGALWARIVLKSDDQIKQERNRWKKYFAEQEAKERNAKNAKKRMARARARADAWPVPGLTNGNNNNSWGSGRFDYHANALNAMTTADRLREMRRRNEKDVGRLAGETDHRQLSRLKRSVRAHYEAKARQAAMANARRRPWNPTSHARVAKTFLFGG